MENAHDECENKIRVFMLGPDRSVHGGISGVVNNYYAAGLGKKVYLEYLPTMVEGSKLRKLCKAGTAYLRFLGSVNNFDVIHVNSASDRSFERKSFFIKAAKRRGKTIVLHQHGGDFENYYAGLSDKRKKQTIDVFNMADHVLVLAEPWKKYFEKITGRNDIEVFPNTIASIPDVDKSYGTHRLLFLGRICKTKGISELLFAVDKLKDNYPELKLVLGGIFEDKSYLAQVKTINDKHGEEFIFCPGWIMGEDKDRLLEEADIFVLPTYFEGQPVCVLEAMANKCAIAASDVGGIPQMIEDDVTGLLCKPCNTDSLIEVLERLLVDANLCKTLGVNAKVKVETDFSLEKSIERLVEIYTSMEER